MGSDYFIGGASGVTYTPGIPNMDGDVGKCVCVCAYLSVHLCTWSVCFCV